MQILHAPSSERLHYAGVKQQQKKPCILIGFQELQGFSKKRTKRSKMSVAVASQIRAARWALT